MSTSNSFNCMFCNGLEAHSSGCALAVSDICQKAAEIENFLNDAIRGTDVAYTIVDEEIKFNIEGYVFSVNRGTQVASIKSEIKKLLEKRLKC